MTGRFATYTRHVLRYAACLLLYLLVAALFRCVFLAWYGQGVDMEGYWGDLPAAFSRGARLDLLVGGYLFVPLLLLAALAAAWPHRSLDRAARIWASVALPFYALFLFFDFFYYGFFGNHFNILTFGIAHDDTGAVLSSMWSDFPVVRAALVWAALSALLLWCVALIWRGKALLRLSQNRWVRRAALLALPLTALMMRGSLGVFPLRAQDAYISGNNFVNMVCANPALTLKEAWTDYRRTSDMPSVDELLSAGGFASDRELVAEYLGVPQDSLKGDPLDALLRCVPPAPQGFEYPHVVFLQMESMGTMGWDLHGEGTDLLGELGDQLPHCITFPDMLPHSEGTIYTLEGLITGTTLPPVSQTPYSGVHILSSVLDPFLVAGYRTVFVSGAKQGWRNLSGYLPAQGFQSLCTQETLLRDFPDAQLQDWGAYDQYMFLEIERMLSGATQPQFIYGMTITNHSPFSLPAGLDYPDVAITPRIAPRMQIDHQRALGNLKTFRYANDCLGSLIRAVRQSPLADKVIIAATGDHSFKGTFSGDPGDMLDKYRVPLILYVPDRYMADRTADTARRGSHKDIFPTLFNLALPGARYYALGEDMLCGGANPMGVDTQFAAVDDSGAVTTDSGLRYQWVDGSLEPAADPARLDDLVRRLHLWNTVTKYVMLRSMEK